MNIICANDLPSSMMDKSDPFAEVKVSKGSKSSLKT